MSEQRTQRLSPEIQQLFSRLQTVADACTVAQSTQQHSLKSVDIMRPQLGVVLHGRKLVSTAAQTLELEAGDMLIISRPCTLNVVNMTDGQAKRYTTICLPICEEVLHAARILRGDDVHTVSEGNAKDIAKEAVASYRDQLTQWGCAMLKRDMVSARLALTQLVLALVAKGYPQLLVQGRKDIKLRIYELVQRDPQYAWQSSDVEHLLGMSGATLRRRLAQEKVSLRQLILNARLHCAMDMLYTTSWPLKTIAAKVGYQSTSAFSRRFKERYGLLPEHISHS